MAGGTKNNNSSVGEVFESKWMIWLFNIEIIGNKNASLSQFFNEYFMTQWVPLGN